METYGHDYSVIYDLFYRDKDYQSEVNRILELIPKKSEGKKSALLDLACGTGRHLELLWKAGLDITGSDISPGMLATARKRLAAAGAAVDLECRDMAELPSAGKSFDAVLCAFDAIGYVRTNERVGKVLAGAANRLCPGGVFIFDFWHAAAMSRHFEPCRLREVEIPGGGKISRVSETAIDWSTQTATVTYTFFSPGASETTWKEKHFNRFFSVPEMSLFLEGSGFSSWNFYPGYQTSQSISDETWHILAVAQKS